MTPVFETERLVAREYDPSDAEAAFEMYGDPVVMQFIGPTRVSESVEQQREKLVALRDKYRAMGEPFGAFALVEKATHGLVGTGLLKPLPDAEGRNTADFEIGWHLARKHWGRGFATEIGRALEARAFDRLPIDVVNIVIHVGNAKSAAVAKRLGATFRGMTKKYYGEELELFQIDRNARGVSRVPS